MFFFISSLDNPHVKGFPVHVFVKKNGFADEQIHRIKKKIVQNIKHSGFLVPYIFSDGDGLEQKTQNLIMKSWLPLLLENIKDIELSENFLIKNNFFNFSLPLSNGDDFLSYTDGMHLLKRMRYEVVNRIYLFLVKYDGKKYQKVSFYLPEFQKLVSSKCGKFVFSSNGLTKMDDDYPHLIFGEDMCQFILTILLTNKDQNIKRIAFKWLIFCIIGCSLDLLVNGNKAIPEENHFSVVILGFFLMFQIERKTCNSQYLP